MKYKKSRRCATSKSLGKRKTAKGNHVSTAKITAKILAEQVTKHAKNEEKAPSQGWAIRLKFDERPVATQVVLFWKTR